MGKILKYKNTENGALSEVAVASEEYFSKEIALPYKFSQGYSGDENGVVGKNAKTGADRADAQKTTRWAVSTLSPDGDYTYFTSPEICAIYVDWRDYLPDDLPDGIEFPESEEFPDDWRVADE